MSRWELLSCPRCATPDPKPIHYGLPDNEGLRMAQQGIVELGGCEVWDGLPLWQCWACGERWGQLRRDCWPPDLVAPVDAITVAQVVELLEDEGWEQGFAIRESGDVEPTCNVRFHKADFKTTIRLRTGLDSDEIEVWIDGPDPQGDHDRVYSLLEKLGFVNPTRTRPWWKGRGRQGDGG